MAGQVCANPIPPQLRGWRLDPRGRLRAPEAGRDLPSVARRGLLRGDRLAGGPVVHLLLPAQAIAYARRARLGREKPLPVPDPSVPDGAGPASAAVWALRRQFPFMGKRRARLELSESRVGRILDKDLRLRRIMPCAYCRDRTNVKRRRSSTDTLNAGRYGQRAKRPGELVRIDHMSLSRDSKQLKEFKAVSPDRQAPRRSGLLQCHRQQRETLPRGRPDRPPARSSSPSKSMVAASSARTSSRLVGIFVSPSMSCRPGALSSTAAWSERTTLRGPSSGISATATSPWPMPTRPLAAHRYFHNHTRPHQALDWKTPNEYLRNTKDYLSQSHIP